MKITISDELRAQKITLGYTVINFQNEAHNQKIWQELLDPLIKKIESDDTLMTIKENQMIQKTRKVYKALGKDPARFRPSSESLWRKLVQKKGLYQVNALVDLTNYFSLKEKIPLGSYDEGKLQGEFVLAKGTNGDCYQGIGKAQINVADSLVLKDELGAFGNPSADSKRTMITEKTTKAVIVTYFFDLSTTQKNEIQEMIASVAANYLKNCTILEQGMID